MPQETLELVGDVERAAGQPTPQVSEAASVNGERTSKAETSVSSHNKVGDCDVLRRNRPTGAVLLWMTPSSRKDGCSGFPLAHGGCVRAS